MKYQFLELFKVAELHPLIGSKESLSCLVTEYKQDLIYKSKSEKLCDMYTSIRRVRPDGNCFYRGFRLNKHFQYFSMINRSVPGFGYSYFEKLLNNENEWKRFQALVVGTKDQLLAQGFPKFTLEDFYDAVISHHPKQINFNLIFQRFLSSWT